MLSYWAIGYGILAVLVGETVRYSIKSGRQKAPACSAAALAVACLLWPLAVLVAMLKLLKR
jgi:hypothetical protein